MKIVKKLIVTILLFVLIVPSFSYAEGIAKHSESKKQNNFKIALDICKNFEMADNNIKAYEKKFNKGFDKSKENKIILDIFNDKEMIYNGNNLFLGNGNIILAGEKIPFNVTGYLYPVDNENGEIIIGTLMGYTNNVKIDENTVSLSIHYMPKQNKAFITACLGIDNGKGSLPVLLDYGDPFKEQNKVVIEKLEKEKIKNNNNDYQNESESVSALSYGGTPTDYDPRLKNTAYSTNNSLSVSVYYQNKARFQTPNEVSAKVSANKANFESFMRNAYGYDIISDSTSTDTVKLEIVSAENYYESMDSMYSVVPPAGNASINFTLPVYIGLYNIGWQTIGINIPTSSTTVSFRATVGADPGRKNITTWEFWRLAAFASTNFFTTSSTPGADSCGLGGKSKYYYVMGVSSNKTITVGANGSTTLRCVDYDNGYYNWRTYNTSATAASSMIISPN